jgi:hypothetical protein
MTEGLIAITGLIFILSLSGCGGPNPQAMAAAADAALNSSHAQTGGHGGGGSNGGGGQGAGQGKGKGGGGAGGGVVTANSTCDVMVCQVSQQTVVCTDAVAALNQYGVDVNNPTQPAPNGDHVGGC